MEQDKEQGTEQSVEQASLNAYKTLSESGAEPKLKGGKKKTKKEDSEE